MNFIQKFLKPSSPFLFKAAFKSHSSGEKPKTIVRKQFYKLKENQKKFQKRDGKPVWLKGKYDRLQYQITWISVFVGMALSLHVIYTFSFKKTLFRSEE